MTPLYDKILDAWVRTQAHEYVKPLIQRWNALHPGNPFQSTVEWLELREQDILWDHLAESPGQPQDRLAVDDDGNVWFHLTHKPDLKHEGIATPRDHLLYWVATPVEFLQAAAKPVVMPVHADSAQSVIDRELLDHNTQILQIPDTPDWETAVKTHTPNGHHDEANRLYWTQAPLHTDLLPGALYLATPLDTPIVY